MLPGDFSFAERVLCQVSRKARNQVDALFEIGVGRDVIGHRSVVVGFVGLQIEISGSRQAEDDCFGFARFLALQGFVDGRADGVARFRSGKDSLDAGEVFRGLENIRLFHGPRFDQLVVVSLGKDGTHTVIAESAGMVRGRDEFRAERIHLGERTHVARVAEVVGEYAAGEARARCGFHRDDPVIPFAADFFTIALYGLTNIPLPIPQEQP